MTDSPERISRKDLLEAVTAKTGLKRGDALKCMDATFEMIALALARGHAVSIRGFGTFDMRETPKRTRRDARTGGEVEVPAGRKARLRLSSSVAP